MSIRDFIERTEAYAVEIIHGRNRTAGDRAFRMFLFSLSHLYRTVTQIRIYLFERMFWRRTDLGSNIVSVGNLTAGGTGKTPVVELLSRTLAMRNRKVAILSRGYRSKSRTFLQKLKMVWSGEDYRAPKVVSDGNGVLMEPLLAGDEPHMLAQNLLKNERHAGVPVVVDKDRVLAGRYAIDKFGADVLILDDGFQYLRLLPRTNIVLVDSTNPFFNHEMLPIGLLREPIENIRRANYIFLTKSKGRKSLRHLKAFLQKRNPNAPIIECNHEPMLLKELWSEEEDAVKPLEWLRGHRAAAICGIAVPESFENYLTQLGAELVLKKHYVDHHIYKEREIEDFCREAREAGADVLVTTEKDAVRIPSGVNTHGLRFFFLRIAIHIIDGEGNFEECIRTICGQ